MPEVGIVCADSSVADIDGVEAVFDEVAGDDEEVEQALRRILDAFEEVHGLGSLLDVRGTLGDLFEDDSETEGVQITLDDDPTESHTIGQVLHSLREAVDEHRDSDSFLAQDLRSFVRLLDILAQDYDVALMNPPYGSQNRMPESIQEYVETHYEYAQEFYITFFEVCQRLSKSKGRVGMLVPWSFMFKQTFREFREDFAGKQGGFDFLSEFGYGILDNATVGTVGTVVQTNTDANSKKGTFIRLHDIDTKQKETAFTHDVLTKGISEPKRLYDVDLSEFSDVPGTPLCYSIPKEIRRLHDTDVKLDNERGGVEGTGIADAVQGLATGNNDRFISPHWEVENFDRNKPIAKGGSEAWTLPRVISTAEWGENGTVMRRSGGSVIRNDEWYGDAGLTWTYIKRTGRRFGYFPAGGLFSHTGFMLFPKKNQEIDLWTLLGVINSDLYHNLFLSITTERHWNVGEIGRIPWHQELEDASEVADLSQEQYHTMLAERMYDPTSPYYVAPGILPVKGRGQTFYDHPHTNQTKRPTDGENRRVSNESVSRASRKRVREKWARQGKIESLADDIDKIVYDKLGIDPKIREEAHQEIFLRTAEDPENREIPDLDSIPEVPDNINQQVKDLVHHFAMEAVREESDEIIPLYSADDQPDMLDQVVERFEGAYGEHAEDRLVEVDDILGSKSAAEEAYPNLRTFIEEDLFNYHIDRMENTPIFWKLTTERLLADSTGEGFACFIDYHSLDSGLFDRLANQYLEPRKAELRERRSAANRRRGDDSLSTSEQAEAAEQYERCASGLNQINVFEDVIQELGSTTERDFDDEDRQRVEELAPKVAAFREETRKRVDTLAELREREGEKWFKDTFSDKFWEAVDEWRDEWIDALEELERACEEYAKPVDEPVEAHLADLFDYFNWRLKGSDHYSSSGILFMTYYFEREGADLLDEDGQPFENLTEDERLLASLAMGLDDSSILDTAYLEAMADDEESADDLPPLAEFKALAEEIDDRCQAVHKRIPSDWSDRALSEVTTAGYQPNRKHGVEINITPLAEAEVVPKTVDDKVL